MGTDRPTTIPIKLLLIPSAVGLIAWGLMAKTTHGGLGLPSSVMLLLLVAVLGAILLEIFVQPVAIRRLRAVPSLRTGRNIVVVVLATVVLAFQLLLLLL